MSKKQLREHSIYRALSKLPTEEKKKIAKYFLEDNPAKDYFSNSYIRRTWAGIKATFSGEYSKRIREIQATFLAIEDDLSNTGNTELKDKIIQQIAEEAGFEDFNHRVRYSTLGRNLIAIGIVVGTFLGIYEYTPISFRLYTESNRQKDQIERLIDSLSKEVKRCEADKSRYHSKIHELIDTKGRILNENTKLEEDNFNLKIERDVCYERVNRLERELKKKDKSCKLDDKTDDKNREIKKIRGLLKRCNSELNEYKSALEAWRNGTQTERK